MEKQISSVNQKQIKSENIAKPVKDDCFTTSFAILSSAADTNEYGLESKSVVELNDYIKKLENLLADEKKVNEALKNDFKVLNKKYVRVLATLVRAQQQLISRKLQTSIHEER